MKTRRNFIFGLVIFVGICESTKGSTNVNRKTNCQPTNQPEPLDPGNTLFLTPLIESGRINDARARAKVEHGQMNNVKSYAGFFTVNETYNSNTFFWYFPAKVNSENAPLVLWLVGGPGASCFFGVFVENGPFEQVTDDSMPLKLRSESWSNSHNLIYMDNPIGSGYSFTDNEAGYARDQTQIGQDVRNALLQFFQLFPNLRKNDFFVSGTSYAGKFVPAVSWAIDQGNPTLANKINLKGLIIGNGFTDPVNQLLYGDFLYQIGLVDLYGKEQFHALEEEARVLIRQNRHEEAYDVLSKLIEGDPRNPPTLFKNFTGYDSPFNFLDNIDRINVEKTYGWMQRADVRRSINVGDRTFNPWGANVASYLKNEGTQSVAHLVAALLPRYKILIYTGQLDIVVAYPLVQNYLLNLSWSGANNYKKGGRKQWRVEGNLAGYVKTVDNLTDVLVRNAGHLVTMDQPKWALELVTKFMRGTAI